MEKISKIQLRDILKMPVKITQHENITTENGQFRKTPATVEDIKKLWKRIYFIQKQGRETTVTICAGWFFTIKEG